jgi:sialate O-acetylesterase
LKTLSVNNTAIVVTIDIGEASNIHPKNKQDVGRRLALAALGLTYGNKIEYSGPIYDSCEVQGSKLKIVFKHTGDGLVSQGDKLTGFAVCGEDGSYVWADAKIEGNSVIVWNDNISKPVAARYGWAFNPDCNLYNKAGLPASPFRTDETK